MATATSELRRTQEERRATTRAALLDATIDCLAEHGYVRTTARLVSERAGVSRGACTHHFPTTEELVIAAIERMFSRLADEFAEKFQTTDRTRPFADAIDELWEIVQGPSYAAVLEVIVAARTDETLGDVVRAVAVMLEQTINELVGRVFPALVDDPNLPTIIDVCMAVAQGAAVSRIAGFGNPDAVMGWVKSAAAALVDQPAS